MPGSLVGSTKYMMVTDSLQQWFYFNFLTGILVLRYQWRRPHIDLQVSQYFIYLNDDAPVLLLQIKLSDNHYFVGILCYFYC